MSWRSNVWADLGELAALKHAPWPSVGALIDLLTIPGAWAVILWRTANHLNRAGLKPFSRILYFANVVLFGADLAPTAQAGPGLAIPHPTGVGFASGVRLGDKTRLMGGVRLGGGAAEDPALDGFPTVGNETWWMDGAKAFGPIKIGDRSVIGTNSVVLHDVQPDSVMAGNPARRIRYREGVEED